MSRMVSVWLPHLAIERLKRERAGRWDAPSPAPDKSAPDKSVLDERPFALVGNEDGRLVLSAVNGSSEAEGLAPGLGLADARAICPHLLTLPAAAEKDAEILLALARLCSRYSPSLNIAGSDGLWLDVTGIPHLFGGETALLADMARRLARLGFTGHIAIAETHGAAHALARYGRITPAIVADGKIPSALAPLPVDALRLEPETAGLLKRLGLKRIGQLYDLPRPSLARRFHSRDAGEAVLLRLDQALGRRQEPCTPLFSAPRYEVRLPFAEPLITHAGVIAGLERLASELCQSLARAHQGARHVLLLICRADGSSSRIEAGFSAPTHEPRHLLQLLQDKVEAIDAGFGIDLMLLAALATERLSPAQTGFAETGKREAAAPLIDRLANRLGARAVRRLHPEASHLPERAQRLRSAFAGTPSWAEQRPAKPERPTLLFAKPEPLSVLAEIPEGPPSRFTWRRVTRRVVKAQGPERIAPEWWRELFRLRVKERSKPRDYYRIEDEDGHRYWVFREGLYQESEHGAPSWYLHGIFG